MHEPLASAPLPRGERGLGVSCLKSGPPLKRHRSLIDKVPAPSLDLAGIECDLGHAGIKGGAGDGGGDAGGTRRSMLSGIRIFGVQLFWSDEIGDGVCGRDLHLVVDAAGFDVERAPENAGERERIVDLIRVVTAAGRDR